MGMSQTLPLGGVTWVEKTSHFNEDFIKIYNDDSDEEYFLEADVQYHEKFHSLQNYLHFLSERMKIEKVVKLVPNLHDIKEYVMHIRDLKASIKSWISIEKSAETH